MKQLYFVFLIWSYLTILFSWLDHCVVSSFTAITRRSSCNNSNNNNNKRRVTPPPPPTTTTTTPTIPAYTILSSEQRMTVKGAGFGISTLESTKDAVMAAVDMAKKELGDDNIPTMAFVSSTVNRNIDDVRKAFVNNLPNDIPIHGLTSSGAILTTTKGAMVQSIGCLLVAADDGDFITSYDKEDGTQAVINLENKLKKISSSSSSSSSSSPRAILMTSTPGTEEGIIASLNEKFPGIPVFGGTAADDDLNGSWIVFSSNESSNQGISLVAISSDIHFGASMVGPYVPTSVSCIATKTKGRRVYEINHQPAADWIYKNWLGDDVKDQYVNGGLILPQTAQKPIAFRANVMIPGNNNHDNDDNNNNKNNENNNNNNDDDDDDDEFITAHCAAFGGKEKYVDFFTPIPQGSTLIVMDSGNGPSTGYSSALCTAYDTALENMKDNNSIIDNNNNNKNNNTPKAGLLIYCGGMAIAVGDNLNVGLLNTNFLQRINTLPMMGMTCFGEQAYLSKSKTNVQRNLSVGMILLG